MAGFFHGSGIREEVSSSSSSDITVQKLQQHNLKFLMNPQSHALVHAPSSGDLPVGGPTTMDQYYSNLCFNSIVEQNPNQNSTRVITQGTCVSHIPPPILAMVPPANCQKLSLGLSSSPQTQTQTQIQTPYMMTMKSSSPTTDLVEPGSSSPNSTVTNGVVSGAARVIRCLDPRLLKAARELLDELVTLDNPNAKKNDLGSSKGNLKVKTEFSGGISIGQLTPAYRQELQMKKVKLVYMIEEVEHRYKQYHEQTRTMILSFEQAVGLGAAKAYTTMALHEISKRFRCLKETITSEIKIIRKCLGEDDSKSVRGKGNDCNGLGLLADTQLRHWRFIQNRHANAWRPQRGLPEQAVSILRAWLFEHFLHPYPRDLDKQLLAKQTGLTRSQVSNWFINARVRLWKPMVEEMYVEEMKGQEDNSNNKDHNTISNDSTSTHLDPLLQKSNLCEKKHQRNDNNSFDQRSSSIVSTDYVAAATSHGGVLSQQKKQRTIDNDAIMHSSLNTISSFDVERKQQGNHTAKEAAMMYSINGGLEDYHHAMMYGNSFSLSLGLPHNSSCEQTFSDNIQFGTSQQIELSGVSPSSSMYQHIDIPDKKRFITNAASLLPDFLLD